MKFTPVGHWTDLFIRMQRECALVACGFTSYCRFHGTRMSTCPVHMEVYIPVKIRSGPLNYCHIPSETLHWVGNGPDGLKTQVLTNCLNHQSWIFDLKEVSSHCPYYFCKYLGLTVWEDRSHQAHMWVLLDTALHCLSLLRVSQRGGAWVAQ